MAGLKNDGRLQCESDLGIARVKISGKCNFVLFAYAKAGFQLL